MCYRWAHFRAGYSIGPSLVSAWDSSNCGLHCRGSSDCRLCHSWSCDLVDSRSIVDHSHGLACVDQWTRRVSVAHTIQ
jgi:hypothetical protein